MHTHPLTDSQAERCIIASVLSVQKIWLHARVGPAAIIRTDGNL